MCKVVKYTTVDVYYNENDIDFANKEKKKLEKLGYKLNQEGSGSPFGYCDQYIKYHSKKQNKVVEPHGCIYEDSGEKFVCTICGESIGTWLSREINNDK